MIAETINVIAVLAGRGAQRRLVDLATVRGLSDAGDYALASAAPDPDDLIPAGDRT
jgi:type IV secretion system protein VirB11